MGSGASGKPEAGGPESSDDVRRVLVVVATEVAGDRLVDELRERASGGNTQLMLVAPAVAGSRFQHAMGDVDDARGEAEERLEASVAALREEGVEVDARTGDSDPILAIEDALQVFPADEIVLVTHPDDQARWLEGDMFDRAKQKFSQPILHVEVAEHDGHAEVTDVERDGEGVEEPPDAEVDPRSRNMPKLSARDILGIAVAVIGTLVLVILAGTCEGSEVQRDEGIQGAGSDGGCVARYVIAGVAALVNLAHIVGLVLFQSLRYRGFWERFFSWTSLIGTPIAIILSLLVG
jgi:hypothetical protein